MSKMYEALKKAQQQGADIDVPEPITRKGCYDPPPAAEESLPASETGHLASRNGRPNPSEVRRLPIQVPERSVVIPWGGADGHGGEQYRIIRTRIVQHKKHPRILIVSSPGSGDGKTVSAINIAGVLSLRDNANVLLIDGDLRRTNVSSTLGLPAEPGLANVLSGSGTLQEAIIQVDRFPNFYVLPAGASTANPAELLDNEKWKSLCSTVRECFSFVIIDAPPVAAVADYELIQASCDGVIFVVRPDHTDRTLCNKAFELIPQEKQVGVVLNCAFEWFLWKTHKSYYYYGSRERK